MIFFTTSETLTAIFIYEYITYKEKITNKMETAIIVSSISSEFLINGVNLAATKRIITVHKQTYYFELKIEALLTQSSCFPKDITFSKI